MRRLSSQPLRAQPLRAQCPRVLLAQWFTLLPDFSEASVGRRLAADGRRHRRETGQLTLVEPELDKQPTAPHARFFSVCGLQPRGASSGSTSSSNTS